MIRAAKMSDAFTLVDLMKQVKGLSIYNGLQLDEQFARKLFAQMAQRHGGSHDGASCLFVQDGKGVIGGFVCGMLDRVYHVGTDLWATDVFLYVTKQAPRSTMQRLLEAYIQWAENNPRVYEVRLSASDATPTGRRMQAIYNRMGFEESARVYRRANPHYQRRMAA